MPVWLPRPWQCPRCGVFENPGPPAEHECDPRTVARLQSQQIISKDAQRDLERWLNVPWGR